MSTTETEHPYHVGQTLVSRRDGSTGIVRVVESTPRLSVKHWVHMESPPLRGLRICDARDWMPSHPETEGTK